MRLVITAIIFLIVFTSGCITQENEPLPETEPFSSPTPDLIVESDTELLPITPPESPSTQPPSPAVFYSEGGLSIEHYWPGEQFLSTEESEMLVYNEGSSPVEFTSTNMMFILNGKSHSPFSGTWEKFPSRESWEKIDYVNILLGQYQGEPLILGPGQKGKIHYHYEFDDDLNQSQDQMVQISLIFTRQGEDISLEEKLTRTDFDSQPTVDHHE